MKFVFGFLMIAISSLPSFGQQDTIGELMLAMEFDTTHIDFGLIDRGEVVDTAFYFTNTGDIPLEIELVSGCDCTTLDWSRGEIASGERGKIDVHFDSTEKENSETVDVDVYFLTPDPATGHPFFKILEFKFEFDDE